MTGLCGWALGGIALQSDGARARLSSMTETFSKAGAESASHVSGPASCFVRAWQSDARVVEDSGLIAAIDAMEMISCDCDMLRAFCLRSGVPPLYRLFYTRLPKSVIAESAMPSLRMLSVAAV